MKKKSIAVALIGVMLISTPIHALPMTEIAPPQDESQMLLTPILEAPLEAEPASISEVTTIRDIFEGHQNLALYDVLCQRNNLEELTTDFVENCETIALFQREGDLGSVTSLKGLEVFTNLKNLYLEGMGSLSNLDGIETLTQLEWIAAVQGQLEDIDAIENLHKLHTLNFDHNKISHLPNMHHLDALIPYVEVEGGWCNNVYLSFNNIPMTEFSSVHLPQRMLDAKPWIEAAMREQNPGYAYDATVYLDPIDFEDNTALYQIFCDYFDEPRLRKETIENCQTIVLDHAQYNLEALTSLKGMSNFKSLLALDIIGAHNLTNLDGVQTIQNLECLTVNSSGIDDASAVSECSNLIQLYLEDNQLKTLPNLTALTRIIPFVPEPHVTYKNLSFSYNQIDPSAFNAAVLTEQMFAQKDWILAMQKEQR